MSDLKRAKLGRRLTLDDLVERNEVEGKRILMRVDFNVPLNKDTGEITNDQRIVGAIPTINFALNEGKARSVVLMSHLGRPAGRVNQKFSLRVVANRLEKILGRKVIFLSDCIGKRLTSLSGPAAWRNLAREPSISYRRRRQGVQRKRQKS